MPDIRFEGETYALQDGQSVLDCLLEHGVSVPFGCRAGICQSCLMRAGDGALPESAQQGLQPTLREQRYFLACICHPDRDLAVALPGSENARIPALIRDMELLNAEVMRVDLESHAPVDYRAGQFINLFRTERLGRSYSLASLPSEDRHLHIHVRRLPNGLVSGWVHGELRPGHTVEIQGPGGDCYYLPGNPSQGLLLIGTGTGLAPLYGIVRDALAQGHAGPIRLFHGSRELNGLYLIGELRELARVHSNFDYTPCLSGGDVPKGYAAGRAHEIALQEVPRLNGWRIFLCGHPDMVKNTQKKAFLAGASMKDILSDPFTVRPAAGG
jgi:CDP-4-dehydro-6-deoxyglucose reductase